MNNNTKTYQDKIRPVAERVEDLLQRMTLQEKAGQVCVYDGRERDEAWYQERHIGAFYNVVSAEQTDRMQEVIGKQSRLGIPILFALDCIHGHAFPTNTTVCPTPLAPSPHGLDPAVEPGTAVA